MLHYQLQALLAIVVVDVEPVGDLDQVPPCVISALRLVEGDRLDHRC